MVRSSFLKYLSVQSRTDVTLFDRGSNSRLSCNCPSKLDNSASTWAELWRSQRLLSFRLGCDVNVRTESVCAYCNLYTEEFNTTELGRLLRIFSYWEVRSLSRVQWPNRKVSADTRQWIRDNEPKVVPHQTLYVWNSQTFLITPLSCVLLFDLLILFSVCELFARNWVVQILS